MIAMEDRIGKRQRVVADSPEAVRPRGGMLDTMHQQKIKDLESLVGDLRSKQTDTHARIKIASEENIALAEENRDTKQSLSIRLEELQS